MAESAVTMFGVYISNLSVSIGLGGQGGSMQLTLVEDEKNNIVLPKDEDGYPFFGGGVNSPTTGSACYFKYGGFYFGGIFQRWTYKEDATGGRTYDIVLVSPAKLMDGVQVIIENYNGTTDRFANQYNNFDHSTNIEGFHCIYGNIKNVFNVYAAYENPFYGANGQYVNFGASKFNTSGVPLDTILTGMEVLMKKDSPNIFGGPICFGVTENGDAGTEYSFDLLDLADFFVNENIDFSEYRLKGPVKNVNGIISEMGELFQFDYYYSIQHRVIDINTLEDGGGQIPDAMIKLKVMSKRAAPQKNQIRKFIQEELSKPNSERKLMSYSIGKEFGDTVTQKIVWGAKRTRYLKIMGSDIDQQQVIWGKDSSNPKNYNSVGTISSIYDQPNRAVNVYIEGYGNYLASAFELRMAQGGKNIWQILKTFQTLSQSEPNGYNNPFTAPWSATFDGTSNLISTLAGGTAGNSYDLKLTNLQKSYKQWDEALNETADKIFSGISNLASQSYGQEFLLKLPTEITGPGYNIYTPNDEFQTLKSWEVSDSAFDSQPLTRDIASYDAMGRVTSLVCYPLRADSDYSSLGTDYNIGSNAASGSVASRKGSPEKESFFDSSGFFGGGFLCVFKTGSQVKVFDSITTPDFGLTVLADIFFNITIPPAAYIGSGKESLQFQIPPDVLLPNIFGVPQQSTRLNYGPWITLNPSAGGYFNPNGKAEAIEDESMRPETYGSYGALEQIGGIVAAVAKTDLIEAESGYIELAGRPDSNIGERFIDNGPYVSSMNINIDPTGGVKTTYQFNTWTPQFGKIAKYNIDRIQKVNNNKFSFLKKKRDEIEQRPFPKIRFEKTDFSELTKSQLAGDSNALFYLLSNRNMGKFN
jgi:hypothetical protein